MQPFAKANIELAKFIRWPINAWLGPEGDALRCMNYLRGEKEYIWLKGCVAELLEAATNTDPELQGYLLTSRHEPATASDVGSMLRVDGRKALAVLTRLEKAGFLERVPWPPADSNGPIPDDPSLRLLQDVAKASTKGAGKGGEKGRCRGEKAGQALVNDGRSETNAAQAKVETTAAAETPPTQPIQSGEPMEAGKSLTCPKCGHVGKPSKAGATLGQCSQCGTTVANGSSTPKTSTSPDGRVGLAQPTRAGASHHAHPPSIIPFVHGQAIEARRYSAAGNAFGEEVCAALGWMAQDGSDYANEIAHWAKLYDDGIMTLTELGQEKVKKKVMRLAMEIRTGKRSPEHPNSFLERCLQNAIIDQRRAKKGQTA